MNAAQRTRLWLAVYIAASIALGLLLLGAFAANTNRVSINFHRLDLVFERAEQGYITHRADGFNFDFDDTRMVEATDFTDYGWVRAPFAVAFRSKKQLVLYSFPHDEQGSPVVHDYDAILASLKSFIASDKTGDFATFWAGVTPTLSNNSIVLRPTHYTPDYQGMLLCIAFWTSPFVVWRIRSRWKHWSRLAELAKREQCPNCSYSRAGLPTSHTSRCPECGFVLVQFR